jgi:hypothetical protein
MTVEVLPVALVVTVLVVMTATAAEVLHLATMTIVETPTLVLLHPALAVLQLTITHRPEAVLILLMMAMVHLLQPAATRLTLTPTVTAESLESPGNPESLTAVLPALPRDASVATTQAMIVDLTDLHRFDRPITATNQQVEHQEHKDKGRRAVWIGW